MQKKGSRNDKTSWFTRLGYNNILMMPASPGGELMEVIGQVMKNTASPMGFKTLVLEDGGKSVKSDMVKSNPFPTREGCKRKECVMCDQAPSKGKCWESNVCYKITCNRTPCVGSEVIPTYVGETSRSYFTRGAQHMALYRGKKESSFLWKHTQERHGGVIGVKDYSMGPIARCKDPMTRILTEAVYIQSNEADVKTQSLNSKIEYYGAEYVRPSFSKGPADIY